MRRSITYLNMAQIRLPSLYVCRFSQSRIPFVGGTTKVVSRKTSRTPGPSQGIDFASRHFLETRYREGSDRFLTGVARAKCYNLLYKKHCPGVVDPNSSKALDIGCGPTLTGAIGLAPYVSSIVLSEYAPT